MQRRAGERSSRSGRPPHERIRECAHREGLANDMDGLTQDMDDLAVVTPSFRGDAALFENLHESVLANTAPSVVHHVVVPPSDARLFTHYEGARCRVWTHR